MRLKDNVFVVTGAGSGLGAAVAARFVAQGAKVVLVDLNGEAAAANAAALGDNARAIKAGVTQEADAQAAVRLALDVFGALRGLVNCAGVAPSAKVLGRNGPHKLDAFARTVAVNLIGTFNMMRLCAEAIAAQPPLEDGERGVVINTASIAAFESQIGQCAYAASKGGVASMTLPAARELAAHGIRVVAVAPGVFETPMMAGMPPGVQDALGATVPFPSRLGRPVEFAALAQHICENVMLNGEVIRLDGALRMAAK
jgi:NAD(P)-dependent dehydrogenase (short-subunit alcohol dehydrogenase family)